VESGCWGVVGGGGGRGEGGVGGGGVGQHKNVVIS